MTLEVKGLAIRCPDCKIWHVLEREVFDTAEWLNIICVGCERTISPSKCVGELALPHMKREATLCRSM